MGGHRQRSDITNDSTSKKATQHPSKATPSPAGAGRANSVSFSGEKPEAITD
jgi:hypothetical protein